MLGSRFQVSSVSGAADGGDRAPTDDAAVTARSSLISEDSSNNNNNNVMLGGEEETEPDGTSPRKHYLNTASDKEGIGAEKVPLCEKREFGLALYEDEYNTQGQKIGQMLRSLSLYNSIMPNAEDAESASVSARHQPHNQSNGGSSKPQHSPSANSTNETGALGGKAAPQKKAVKMGTIMGVYLPCLQNIFGVLFFIRLPWIVGTAGIVEAFCVVLLCCTVTFLTSISLSAIATNGVVPSGGPYYMISRNLGPEIGGAVGVLFYLGTTIAAAMYITGAVEILIIYLLPEARIFESIFNNFRLYGSILLALLGLIVLAGVKFVNKFALPGVLLVITCIGCTFIGFFVKFNGTDSLQFCMVGNRPVNLVKFHSHHHFVPNCTADGLRPVFCVNHRNATLVQSPDANGSWPSTTTTTTRPGRVRAFGPPPAKPNCDQYFERVLRVDPSAIRTKPAIPGISSGAFYDNLWPKYREAGDVLTKLDASREPPTDPSTSYWVFAETTTSFMVLVGVFFPSVTGIMAGSNRSGNLRDASRSIPVGTLGAQLTTSFVYLSGTVLFGCSVAEMFIRDKFGSSAMGKLVIAEIAFSFPTIMLVGCCAATIGAGMQSLTGAPRLLQAISADDVIPFLRPFQKTDARGEPIRAIFLTIIICEVGILIAVIEDIAALITQFLLMCYVGVNTSCALQSIMKAPGWRPSFKYFHWSLSTVGALLCISVMFISAWYFALLAIFIGAAVYKYIEYVGAEKEWGDGLKGLTLSAARFALLNVDSRGVQHTRNWRPQLLVLFPESQRFGPGVRRPAAFSDVDETRRGLLSFVSQLKAGKGLTLVAECVSGNYTSMADRVPHLKEELSEMLKRHRIRGFSDVVVAEKFNDGVSCVIQTSGLGGLRHNSVVVAWPDRWTQCDDSLAEAAKFVDTIRNIAANRCAILVPKNIHGFPASVERLTGTIDVYWVVHDGGLLMLLPFLLRKHKTWKNTSIRLFTIAQPEDNTLQMKADLERFLYHLRIEATVHVIELESSDDISEYTYERTLKIEERFKLLKEMLPKEKKVADIQATMDEVIMERKQSKVLERRLSTLSDLKIATALRDSSNVESGLMIDVESGEDGTGVEVSANCNDASAENAAAGASNNNNNKVRFSERSVEIRQQTIDEDVGDGTLSLRRDSSNSGRTGKRQSQSSQLPPLRHQIRPGTYNVRKMHTALKLNEYMRERSADAQLIIINLPGPPEPGFDSYYMEFIEALSEGIRRILLIRGTGMEVITIYS